MEASGAVRIAEGFKAAGQTHRAFANESGVEVVSGLMLSVFVFEQTTARECLASAGGR